MYRKCSIYGLSNHDLLFSEEVDTDEGTKHKKIQEEVSEKNFQIGQVKDSYTKKNAVVGMYSFVLFVIFSKIQRTSITSD